MNGNPLIKTDYPDPDVIRVGDTYYMVSTTMHFMPGCVILRSYNLIDWEILTYVYETLECTDEECLRNEKNAYGRGMWAATLRYHKGIYYICFVANDTGKTYLFRSKKIQGPWKRNEIKGFYHDSSLLFDDDGKVYIAYGNRQIFITELDDTLTQPKQGGFHQMVVEDTDDVYLGYEGTHFYKINGKYYLFFIHLKKGENTRRSQACYMSERIEGPYRGGEVLDTDGGYCNSGVAQGGIVDTPDNEWYSILFRDSGAVGRLPVLVPVHWRQEFPVFGVDGEIPEIMEPYDSRPGYTYAPLYGDDEFTEKNLKNIWQWNHAPRPDFVKMGKGQLCLHTCEICNNVTQAPNTLTQRLMYPGSAVSVELRAEQLKDGDIAGLCLLQSDYALIGITRQDDSFFLVQWKRPGEAEGKMNPQTDTTWPVEVTRFLLDKPVICLRARAEFTKMKDVADFEVFMDGSWQPFGERVKLHFKLDHFCGVRAGLFCYATKQLGGMAAFAHFGHALLGVDEQSE